MKKFLLIIFCTIIFPLSAFSATLQEALKQTFDNNLELQAERKNLEIQQEVINMSRSDLLPTLTLTGKKNFEETNEITTQAGADASVTDVDTSSASIKLEQTLLDGSGRKSEYEKSKLGLNLTEAKLIQKEQEIFLRAIEAYTGLILAYEKLNIKCLPVIINSGEVWPKYGDLNKNQKITISILEPIGPGLEAKEFLNFLQNTMYDVLNKTSNLSSA